MANRAVGGSPSMRTRNRRTTVYCSTVIAVGSIVAAKPSRPHGTGNHSAGGNPVRVGSRITTVPASRSPTP